MRLLLASEREPLCGVAGGLAHLDHKVRDGAGDGVHEAKPTLVDGNVCYEEGGERDVSTLSEADQEDFNHAADLKGQRP